MNVTSKVQNNTIHDVGGDGIELTLSYGGTIATEVENNLVTDSSGADFKKTVTNTTDNTSYNNDLSSDGTADDFGGSNHKVNKSAAVQYLDPDTNLRLRHGADALDAGKTIGTFDWDAVHVSGDSWRPRDAAWDIGALEGACWGGKIGGGSGNPGINPGKIDGVDVEDIAKVDGVE